MDRLPHIASFVSIPGAERLRAISFLKDAYGWDVRPETLEKAQGTVSSEVYRCVAEEIGAITLKRAQWYRLDVTGKNERVIEGLAFLYAASEAMRARGVPLPRVFSNIRGERVIPWEGVPTAVQAYVGGAEFSFTPSSFREAGRMLATCHRIGSAWLEEDPSRLEASRVLSIEMPYEESRQMYDLELKKRLESMHDCTYHESCDALRANVGLLESQMAFVDASGVNARARKIGWLHNDFHAGNILLGVEGEIVAILDIDQSGVGPFVWDVGNTLSSFATQLKKHGREDEIESLTRHFLRAYHSAFPLPSEEYVLCLAAMQRWNLMRILRGLRRHLYEGDRLGELYLKVPHLLVPRLQWAPKHFAFLTKPWIETHLA